MWIILIIIIAIVLLVIALYNRFVRLRQRTNEAWADIDVQLKRRYDLIPNLINTVKGYAEHERGTFDAVTEARAKATQMTVDPSNVTPEQIQALGAAQMDLSQALGRLLAVAENQPNNSFKLSQLAVHVVRVLRSCATPDANQIHGVGNAVEVFRGVFPGPLWGNLVLKPVVPPSGLPPNELVYRPVEHGLQFGNKCVVSKLQVHCQMFGLFV